MFGKDSFNFCAVHCYSVDFYALVCPSMSCSALGPAAIAVSVRHCTQLSVDFWDLLRSSTSCWALGMAANAVSARYVELGYVWLCSAGSGGGSFDYSAIVSYLVDFCDLQSSNVFSLALGRPQVVASARYVEKCDDRLGWIKISLVRIALTFVPYTALRRIPALYCALAELGYVWLWSVGLGEDTFDYGAVAYRKMDFYALQCSNSFSLALGTPATVASERYVETPYAWLVWVRQSLVRIASTFVLYIAIRWISAPSCDLVRVALTFVLHTAILWNPAYYCTIVCPALLWGGQQWPSRHLSLSYAVSRYVPLAWVWFWVASALLTFDLSDIHSNYMDFVVPLYANVFCLALGRPAIVASAYYVETHYARLGWVRQSLDGNALTFVLMTDFRCVSALYCTPVCPAWIWWGSNSGHGMLGWVGLNVITVAITFVLHTAFRCIPAVYCSPVCPAGALGRTASLCTFDISDIHCDSMDFCVPLFTNVFCLALGSYSANFWALLCSSMSCLTLGMVAMVSGSFDFSDILCDSIDFCALPSTNVFCLFGSGKASNSGLGTLKCATLCSVSLGLAKYGQDSINFFALTTATPWISALYCALVDPCSLQWSNAFSLALRWPAIVAPASHIVTGYVRLGSQAKFCQDIFNFWAGHCCPVDLCALLCPSMSRLAVLSTVIVVAAPEASNSGRGTLGCVALGLVMMRLVMLRDLPLGRPALVVSARYVATGYVRWFALSFGSLDFPDIHSDSMDFCVLLSSNVFCLALWWPAIDVAAPWSWKFLQVWSRHVMPTITWISAAYSASIFSAWLRDGQQKLSQHGMLCQVTFGRVAFVYVLTGQH
ncbi:hypothetical protein WN48_07839 [Eufriesea mexicana]|uniref:Uncharacterized protein n=1 Tax=Eufriesea mexicana TaxID=516756 RepID=A0A310SA92_9HYME|nr:hypothetical protein WN48_07839 [Eufriesea mexicana]